MGSASSPAMPSNEKAVSPATAVAGSFPAAASMRNCVAAPNAAPPGTMRLIALPESCDVVTENQALVRRAIRCNAMVHVKCATWSATAKVNQIGSSERQLREGVEDLGQAGEDEIDGDAGHHHEDGLLGDRPPRQRRRDVLFDTAGEPLRHGVAAGTVSASAPEGRAPGRPRVGSGPVGSSGSWSSCVATGELFSATTPPC